MTFSVGDCVCCEEKLMCYDILTERRAGVTIQRKGMAGYQASNKA